MRVVINIIAALAIIVGGWVILSPELTWIGVLLILAGTLILVWELYSYSLGKGWIPAPKIALTDATLKAYEQTQYLTAGAFAESSANNTDGDVRSWYAVAFTNQLGAKLYGKKPPSRKLVEIPPQEIKQSSFRNEAKDLVRLMETDPLFTDLSINRDDFKKCLAEIKKWTVD